MGDSLWHGFQHSMAFISITIPLVYKKNGGQIIIASSFTVGDERVCASYPTTKKQYLQPIITQYFIDNKSEIWLLFLIAHSKR